MTEKVNELAKDFGKNAIAQRYEFLYTYGIYYNIGQNE